MDPPWNVFYHEMKVLIQGQPEEKEFLARLESLRAQDFIPLSIADAKTKVFDHCLFSCQAKKQGSFFCFLGVGVWSVSVIPCM